MKNEDPSEKLKILAKECAQKNWKKLTNKFKRSIPPNNYEYVSVNLTNPQYLNEIGKPRTIKKFTPRELQEYELIFDKQYNCLINHSGQLATTKGYNTKDEVDSLIFVLTKKGNLFVGPYVGSTQNTTCHIHHTSYSNSMPLEMAGTISIKDGKIIAISNNSGHYTPSSLDMYRAVKNLEQHMGKKVFADNIQINTSHSGGSIMSLTEFLQNMESTGTQGSQKYIELAEQRIEKSNKYENWLRAKPLILNDVNQTDLGDFIYNLTDQKFQQLNQEFNKPTSKIIIIKPQADNSQILTDNSFKVYTPEKLIFELMNVGETKAIDRLIQTTDITSRKAFADARPLYHLIKQKPQYYNYTLGALFDSTGIKQLLSAEAESNVEVNILHMLTECGNNDNINYIQKILSYKANILHILVECGNNDNTNYIQKILSYPEGKLLLTKKDGHGFTPMEVAKAKNKGDFQLITLLSEYDNPPQDKMIIELSKLSDSNNEQLEQFVNQQNETIFKDTISNSITYSVEKFETHAINSGEAIRTLLGTEVDK